MLKQRHLAQVILTMIGVLGIGLMPMLAGSGAVGSVAGSRNATLSGEALVPNTTVFSGDNLQVRDGVAVVALDQGNRMVFGSETEASFLREAKAVTVLLKRGDVSLYHPGKSFGVQVKVGNVTVSPAAGYKTLGEVAMQNGSLMVTAKQGALQVERQGRTEQVGEGKTVRLPVKASAAPVPSPAAPQYGNPHITTANTLGVLTLGAGSAAAILAGLDLSRSNDAKAAANNATTEANNAAAAANAAGAAANAAGCALNKLNPTVTPSPYQPPDGYSCP